MSPASLRLKRLTDVVVSTLLLVSLAPVLLGLAGAALLLQGPPVLFRQPRVGRHGRVFRIAKFRSMRVEAGSLVTITGDPRVTPLGRLLRRTKLDELPQLWNVLRGDMSLVGPRPEVPHYVARAARDYRAIARLRPGLTDWASLAFHDEERLLEAGGSAHYTGVILPRKLALARLYQRRRSWVLDLRLLCATACLAVGWLGGMEVLAGRSLLRRARRAAAAGAA